MSLEMKYFVLKPRGNNIRAEASRRALYAYSNYLREEDTDLSLAVDLTIWANKEVTRAGKTN